MNIPKKYFAFVLICWLSPYYILLGQVENSLSGVDLVYNQKKYGLAVQMYDSLLQEGVYSQRSLFQFAHSAEVTGQFAYELLALEKLSAEYKLVAVQSRITQLKKEINIQNVEAGNLQSILYRVNNQYFWLLFQILLIGFLLIIGSLFVKLKVGYRMKKTILFIGIGLFVPVCLLMIYSTYFMPIRCFTITQTQTAIEPSYAALTEYQIPMASICKIISQKDIWYLVEYQGQTVWIPAHSLRIL